jgi:hypothetical protein
MADDGYQFNDDTAALDAKTPVTPVSSSGSRGVRGDNGSYAEEVFSKTIQAKFRTFYIDLKKSSNGYFVKISEKSRGRKSTVMMDMEDVTPMIQALTEAQANAK